MKKSVCVKEGDFDNSDGTKRNLGSVFDKRAIRFGNLIMTSTRKIGFCGVAAAILMGLGAQNAGAQTLVRVSSLGGVSSASTMSLTQTQAGSFDVFVPIAKYLGNGDAEKLSAWFSNSIEISILGESNTCSKSQAKQILRAFYNTYSPRSFEITHKAAQSNVKYALGHLKAGGETFLVSIFLCMKDNCYDIHQLKIERL